MIEGRGPLGLRAGWRGIVSTASTSVSKTESPGSNPGAPAMLVICSALVI